MKKRGSFIKFVLTLSCALTVALLLRTFLFEPFHIPSGSMKSTLLVGDYVFVSKYSYGYSRYSIPFSLPIITGRIFSKLPKAGDVVVFRPPKQPNLHYIKRVIGVPGDKIQLINGFLYVNGNKMKYEKLGDFIDDDGKVITRYLETLYNGNTHEVLDEVQDSSLDNTPLYKVPEGHIFVLGDNRDNSRDSRFITDVGYIPLENVVGKAHVVALSFKKSEIRFLPFAIRLDRIWHTIS
ncbi:signal peptidase I [Ehrlichia canis]|uniref:Signal peptidase I, Serine peptidase, MEROPS family S26A n=1 Tax=Ehrlichia canis (strain Jake) TaxID=269484 RepID=A0ACA6AVM0_EHRCJ|nr:signal peptidase I [Ehrlichia canis]AAZ68405.1 signal peptidase I, Serine peptidase, MEROPS family S26A [Ehrlichia canis str. Jake]AUO54838.1 signal peptidase I [Ehrlichia canis]UKC53489.1 lepB [Ehrlichia canis]UKC54427.1 lepB [Ehrlichia canis]UKC55364.1 lepB [Ehrlichia canis]